MSRKFPKVISAIPVSFHDDGGLDLPGTREIMAFVAGSGVDGAFILGTTGEFPSISAAEHLAVTELALEVMPQIDVVVHVGAPSLFQVQQLIRQSQAAGASAIAVLTPYYLQATEEAIFGFYEAVSSMSSGLRVYVYLFEARSGNAVTPELLARIAALPNIVGAKISGQSLEQIAPYVSAVPAGFEVFTGGDADIASTSAHGLTGVVSGVSSCFPSPFVDAARAIAGGADAELAALQLTIDRVVAAIEGQPGRMKEAHRMMGLNAGTSRMKTEVISEQELLTLRELVDELTPRA
jgi:4-hydroxy-tetrahydrodipicolinate synthase